MNQILIKLIEIYQHTLSPDHGWFRHRHPYGFCRFYPSCSEYARQAIISSGSIRGAYLTFRRLLRCHPWARPGIDLPPAPAEKFN